jgi:CRISPR-associated protein Cas1
LSATSRSRYWAITGSSRADFRRRSRRTRCCGWRNTGHTTIWQNAAGKLLANQELWPFPGRIKRPPTDPINALLSFGYSLLTNKVASAAQHVGFDHFVGYLHSSFYGRPALALDLMEEFRPAIVDSVVLTLLNNRMLTPDDFIVEFGGYRLKQEKRSIFFGKFEERLNEEIRHPVFNYNASYRRCIELQARLLGKYLTNEIEAYPPFMTR